MMASTMCSVTLYVILSCIDNAAYTSMSKQRDICDSQLSTNLQVLAPVLSCLLVCAAVHQAQGRHGIQTVTYL